jgi:hypothetical protein
VATPKLDPDEHPWVQRILAPILRDLAATREVIADIGSLPGRVVQTGNA